MVKQSFRLFKISFKDSKSNWKYLILTILLESIVIALLYQLNNQYGQLYQGIQDYNKDLIWKSVGLFAGIAFLLVFIGGYVVFVSNKLSFSIRSGLTRYFTNNLIHIQHVENVEQKVQEDLRNFGKLSVEFWLSIFKAVVKLPLFLGVIISLTDWYVGVIIFAAVAIGTYLTKLLAKKLIALQAIQESNEANFRKSIKSEASIYEAWAPIVVFFIQINRQLKKLTFLQSGLGQTFVLLPFIILLPLYISKQITMGAFFQSVNALSKVIDSLTILIDQRQLIADIGTTLKRLESLDKISCPTS